MRKKLTKKYAHHTAFYLDHAHIYIYFKLLMQDWITLHGHEPFISFFKFLRSHSSLNVKFHTLNDIKIFKKKYHWEANIIFYNLFFTTSRNSHGIYVFRGLLSSTWVKNQVFITKFGQRCYPHSWNHPRKSHNPLKMKN